jgi:hypothetical protein
MLGMMKCPPNFILLIMISLLSLEHGAAFAENPQSYRYFAFGSNMVESTLTALRQVYPLNATAAILPDYKLRFNIGGGGLLEGAAASVESAPGQNVHGILYTLTPQDFSRVGITEGIPLVYRWERCRVYAYVGDGISAGKEAVAANETGGVIAFTLVKSSPGNSDDSPPSRSYLNLLIQGAEEWKLDRSFRDMLETTSVARNLLVPNGLAGPMLSFAELRQQKRPR